MRLLQHEGDLVCGMDFHVDVREGWDRHWRNIPAAEIMPYGPHGPQLVVRRNPQPTTFLQPRSCPMALMGPS